LSSSRSSARHSQTDRQRDVVEKNVGILQQEDRVFAFPWRSSSRILHIFQLKDCIFLRISSALAPISQYTSRISEAFELTQTDTQTDRERENEVER
jgi:hypothetical protein